MGTIHKYDWAQIGGAVKHPDEVKIVDMCQAVNTDLKIKDGDLIAATHGRSFWILDDISVLAELAENSVPGFSLFKPREYTRVLEQIGSRIEAEGEGKHYMSIILGEPAT